MAGGGKELEVKFYIRNLAGLRQRIEQLGGEVLFERVHETNWRFDTADRELARTFRALRLRQDSQSLLTYKGPSVAHEGARLRQEFEFAVSDFEMAKSFLEGLGYQVIYMYEKYRTTYRLLSGDPLDGAQPADDHPVELVVTLDELPYGHFAEIEGPDGEAIRQAAARLGLDWEARLASSYSDLFILVKAAHGLDFRDLSFDNFAALPPVQPEILAARPADEARPASEAGASGGAG